jgi:hypothetical protein
MAVTLVAAASAGLGSFITHIFIMRSELNVGSDGQRLPRMCCYKGANEDAGTIPLSADKPLKYDHSIFWADGSVDGEGDLVISEEHVLRQCSSGHDDLIGKDLSVQTLADKLKAVRRRHDEYRTSHVARTE